MSGLKNTILGIYHSVQPVHSGGASYKRVRSGDDTKFATRDSLSDVEAVPYGKNVLAACAFGIEPGARLK